MKKRLMKLSAMATIMAVCTGIGVFMVAGASSNTVMGSMMGNYIAHWCKGTKTSTKNNYYNTYSWNGSAYVSQGAAKGPYSYVSPGKQLAGLWWVQSGSETCKA